ncbi:MAG: (d)CMP kinase [Candidatus Zixiibacteriota bacterium]|nr:MAG: (d)CMP kinase [candidate division Zixibacteria bacterium]
MKKGFIITIDGPAGSGKSSTARLLASKLDFLYLDTGAMYRCVALAALDAGVDLKNENAVGGVAGSVNIDFLHADDENKVLLDGEDVSSRIREPRVDSASSLVSSYRIVREKMVDLQRKFGAKGDIIAEGRDMGTVVFPDADLKIFLVADLETRARRRCLQLNDAGIESSIEEQTASLSSRDMFDSNRKFSPLEKAPDAVEIDTSNISLNEQVQKIYDVVVRRLNLE